METYYFNGLLFFFFFFHTFSALLVFTRISRQVTALHLAVLDSQQTYPRAVDLVDLVLLSTIQASGFPAAGFDTQCKGLV